MSGIVDPSTPEREALNALLVKRDPFWNALAWAAHLVGVLNALGGNWTAAAYFAASGVFYLILSLVSVRRVDGSGPD